MPMKNSKVMSQN